MDMGDATAAVGVVVRMSPEVWLGRLGAGGTYHCHDKPGNRSRSEPWKSAPTQSVTHLRFSLKILQTNPTGNQSAQVSKSRFT